MGQRLDLQQLLEDILGSDQVYFQPPPNVAMKYPCIIYKRDRSDMKSADNILYAHKIRYQVIVVDGNPDSEIPGKIAELPYCIYDRFYTADNLNHDVFKIFY
jgi:hypothetical protein